MSPLPLPPAAVLVIGLVIGAGSAAAIAASVPEPSTQPVMSAKEGKAIEVRRGGPGDQKQADQKRRAGQHTSGKSAGRERGFAPGEPVPGQRHRPNGDGKVDKVAKGAKDRARMPAARGTVTAMNGATVTVTPARGAARTWTVDKATKVIGKDRRPGGGITVGDQVLVRGTADGRALMVRVLPAVLPDGPRR